MALPGGPATTATTVTVTATPLPGPVAVLTLGVAGFSHLTRKHGRAANTGTVYCDGARLFAALVMQMRALTWPVIHLCNSGATSTGVDGGVLAVATRGDTTRVVCATVPLALRIAAGLAASVRRYNSRVASRSGGIDGDYILGAAGMAVAWGSGVTVHTTFTPAAAAVVTLGYVGTVDTSAVSLTGHVVDACDVLASSVADKGELLLTAEARAQVPVCRPARVHVPVAVPVAGVVQVDTPVVTGMAQGLPVLPATATAPTATVTTRCQPSGSPCTRAGTRTEGATIVVVVVVMVMAVVVVMMVVVVVMVAVMVVAPQNPRHRPLKLPLPPPLLKSLVPLLLQRCLRWCCNGALCPTHWRKVRHSHSLPPLTTPRWARRSRRPRQRQRLHWQEGTLAAPAPPRPCLRRQRRRRQRPPLSVPVHWQRGPPGRGCVCHAHTGHPSGSHLCAASLPSRSSVCQCWRRATTRVLQRRRRGWTTSCARGTTGLRP